MQNRNAAGLAVAVALAESVQVAQGAGRWCASLTSW